MLSRIPLSQLCSGPSHARQFRPARRRDPSALFRTESAISDSATIVISFAPYSVEAARVAEAALENGSKLIAITDSAVSPIALNADKVLIFAHESPSFFPSLVAATAIAESLVAHLLALEGADAVEQLSIAEQSLHAKGVYVP